MSRAAWTAMLAERTRSEETLNAIEVRLAPAKRRRPKAARSARGTGSRIAQMLAQLVSVEEQDQTIPARQSFPVQVVPKPRMTRSDRWNKRPCVLRYRACCDELRARGVRLPHHYAVIVTVPMPPSWPQTKREAMRGLFCLSKPDMSNYIKTIEDALVPKDETLWNVGGMKVWGDSAGLVVLRAGTEAEAEMHERRTRARAKLAQISAGAMTGAGKHGDAG